MFCTKCGKEILDMAAVCVGCGCPVKSTKVPEGKWSSGAMVALVIGSVLMPLIGIVFGVIGLNRIEKKQQGKLLLGIALLTILLEVIVFSSFVHGDRSQNSEVNISQNDCIVSSSEDPKFVDLGTFTANLQPEDGDRMLQATISVKVKGGDVAGKVAERKPEILHRINVVLQSKKPSEIATPLGKVQLENDIKAQIEFVLGIRKIDPAAISAASSVAGISAASSVVADSVVNSDVMDILFTSIIVQ